MATIYVGLDVGSSSCKLAAMDKEGGVVAERTFGTTEPNLIKAFGEIAGELHVHLEASTLAGWIRRVLKGRVTRIVISHPKMNAWIAKDARKNDRMDARKLADLLRVGLAEKYQVYYSDDPERGVFKQIVQHYDRSTFTQVRLKSQIKAYLRAQGVIARGESVYSSVGRKSYLKQVSSEAAREAITQVYHLLDGALETQKAARKLMRQEARRYPEVARFQEVPGVGLVGACRFSGYVQTPHRFSSKRKLWRYFRLGIAMRTSDDKPVGRQSLDWNGIGVLKDMSRKSFEAAMRTRQDNMFKRAFGRSLTKTNNKIHARLSTQRKIIAVLRAMWIGGTDYQDEKG